MKKRQRKYYHKIFNMNDSWKIFNLTYIDQNNILIDGVKYTKKQ